jgi:hypothetical protein
VGVVRELVYPNKAILHFKLHGKEEKAILLSKVLTLDGKTLDENKLMSEIVRVGEVVEFDCHIYDKGGLGSGKDKCNYYAMRAWKNSKVVAVSLASSPSTDLSSSDRSTSGSTGPGPRPRGPPGGSRSSRSWGSWRRRPSSATTSSWARAGSPN